MRPRRRLWHELRLIAVDLETTGLDPQVDTIVSFGAYPIEHGRILAGEAVYGLCNPGRELPARSIEIHGIRPQDLAGAPPLTEALEPLAAAMRGREAIGHAAWIERAFLTDPLRRHGLRLPRTLIDTMLLWRLLGIERDGRDPGFIQLGRLATALGLPVHEPHHALGDALTTAQAFLALATHLERRGRGRLGALLGAGSQIKAFRALHPDLVLPEGS